MTAQHFSDTEDDVLTVPDPNAPRDKPYEETPEEERLWASFARRIEQFGGSADVEARITELKHPYPLYKGGGRDRQLIDPDGMQIVVELTQKGFEGLRFYREGKYSLDTRSSMYAAYTAATKRRLAPNQQGRPRDMVGKRVIITIVRGEKKDRSTTKGGYFWSISGWKAVGQAFAPEPDPPATPPPGESGPPDDDDEFADVPFD